MTCDTISLVCFLCSLVNYHERYFVKEKIRTWNFDLRNLIFDQLQVDILQMKFFTSMSNLLWNVMLLVINSIYRDPNYSINQTRTHTHTPYFWFFFSEDLGILKNFEEFIKSHDNCTRSNDNCAWFHYDCPRSH